MPRSLPSAFGNDAPAIFGIEEFVGARRDVLFKRRVKRFIVGIPTHDHIRVIFGLTVLVRFSDAAVFPSHCNVDCEVRGVTKRQEGRCGS